MLLLLLPLFVVWGCVPELTKDCIDMTNTSSTYLSIIIGAAIGVAISWWIYDRQKKTSIQQDYILQHVHDLEQKNTEVLMKLENFAERHDELLNRLIQLNVNILELDKKNSVISRKQLMVVKMAFVITVHSGWNRDNYKFLYF